MKTNCLIDLTILTLWGYPTESGNGQCVASRRIALCPFYG